MRKRITILILTLSLAACGPTGSSGSGGNGGSGGSGTGGSSGSGTGGTGGSGTGGTGGSGTCGGVDQTNGCATGAQYIYAVDENGHFFKYNPALPVGQRFTDLGALNCPSTGTCPNGLGTGPATPFSMGVDRNAMAWVLYCDGSLFKVDINHQIACTATSFTKNQNGFEVFGMGFSADAPMSMNETLFIGGGAYTNIDMGTAQFGSIAFPSMGVTRIGNVAMGWPELTGTGDAELWGFFPADTGSPRVAKLNKTNGADVMMYSVNSISGMPAAWAFAFWCDGFYIFLQRGGLTPDASTNVYHVRRSDGMLLETDMNTGHIIVGAGVSTCAPIVGVHYDENGNPWYDSDYQPSR